ncbi:MAG: hypothetical protein KGJ64_03050 [Betaproteobacteria bacterium]|nr:hypothetical protein [Betaproteobacteria bacterium]
MSAVAPAHEAPQVYVDLLKKVLTRFIVQKEFAEIMDNRRSGKSACSPA